MIRSVAGAVSQWLVGGPMDTLICKVLAADIDYD